MIDSFLHPDKAYQAAQDELSKAWGQTQQFETPFWQAGMNQTAPLTNAENALMNPVQLQNQWTQSYQMSPYAQQLMQQARTQGLDAASSMGLMGSSAALRNIQQSAGDISEQDRQQYLNDLMQKYMTGIGIGQNIFNTGAQMAATLGGQSQQQGENQAGLAYGKQAAPGQMFGKLLGMGADVGLNYLTGGLSGAAQSIGDLFKSSYSG